jgi:hypothetical protein
MTSHPKLPQPPAAFWVLLAAVLTILLLAPIRTPRPPVTGQSYPDPIYNELDVITRSLALFPTDHNNNSEIARLITRYDFDAWYEETTSFPTAAPTEFDWSDVSPDAPVWLVAILGDDLTTADVVQMPAGQTAADTSGTTGAYYAWDANTGEVLGIGALEDSGPQSYDSISNLLSVATLTVAPATEPPTHSAKTPGPTWTWHPDDLATAQRILTLQAGTPTP